MQNLLGDTQPDVITSRKDLCGFSGFSGLLAKLVERDYVRHHRIEATGKHQDEGDNGDEPYEVQTEEQD